MAELRAQMGADVVRMRELETEIASMQQELEETRDRIANSTKKMHALLDTLTPIAPTRRRVI